MSNAPTRAYDATKQLWYQDIPGKGRVYDSPVAYGGSVPDIGGGAIHKAPQWDQSAGDWDTGIDWGKIYTYATAGALGAGAASAAGAFGGAANGVMTGPTLAQAGGTGAGLGSGGGAVVGAHMASYIPTLAGTLGSTLAGIYSANKQAGAAKDAAAASLKANEEAMAFEREQAAQAQNNFNTTQKANYDQWAARENRLSSLGSMVGMGARDIPAYAGPQPGQPAPAQSGSGAPPAPGAPPASGGNDLMGQLAQNYQALGVQPTGRGTGPTDIAYYADQIAKTGGATPQNLAYWLGPNGRIASDLAKAKGGAAGGAPTSSTMPATLGAPLQQQNAAYMPITPALAMPQGKTLRDYFAG